MKKIIVILGVLAIGFGVWYLWIKGNANTAANGQATAAIQQPTPSVDVMTITPQTIELTQEVPGRVTPYRQSQVRPQVNGIITKRLFKEGTNVEKGQQLYQIDDAKYVAELNSARADLKSAQSQIKSIEAKANRYKELIKFKAVSQQDYDDIVAQLDQAKAAVDVAKAAVDLAKVNLAYTKVYAPIEGRIGRSYVTEGALVTSNQDQYLAIITQLEPVYVDMQKAGDDIAQIQMYLKDQKSISVSLSIGETNGVDYDQQGTLEFSEVNVDETTGAVALRAVVPNPDSILLPGLFVRATLDLGEQQVILVPQRATTRQADGTITVWVIDNANKAHKTTITAKHAYQDYWIVEDGLNQGDVVAVVGYQKLSEGAQVTPSPWQNANTIQ